MHGRRPRLLRHGRDRQTDRLRTLDGRTDRPALRGAAPGTCGGPHCQSGFARWDTPRMVEGFRRVAGDEVAEIAGRSYAGQEVPDQEWARVFAAFGPHVP